MNTYEGSYVHTVEMGPHYSYYFDWYGDYSPIICFVDKRGITSILPEYRLAVF